MAESQLVNLLENTETNGIRALYKHLHTSRSSASAHVPLNTWHKHFYDLYHTFDKPVFKAITVCNDKLNNPTSVQILTTEISSFEIEAAISQQKSSAKGQNNISPKDIACLSEEITPFLHIIFNYFFKHPDLFPDCWLSTVFFFLHKKGSFTDPSNFRSLAIEDPFLKIFNTCLFNRLSDFVEANNLLPTFQFGFRKNHSTTSAATILKQCVTNALSAGQRVHTCFVDFSKAFDYVDRSLLCTKLQLIGIPTCFSKLIFVLLENLQFRVRSNEALSSSFDSYNGVPQGDPLSLLLFSLFIADLPLEVDNPGVKLDHAEIKNILYADDLVLLSYSADHLQRALNNLAS